MKGMIGATLGVLKKVPFLVWIGIAQFWLLINAVAIAPPEQVMRFTLMIITYMLGIAFFMHFGKPQDWKLSFDKAIPWFMGGLFLGVVVGTALTRVGGLGTSLSTFAGVSLLSVGTVWYNVITHSVAVGSSEEILFRGMLSRRPPHGVTVILSCVLFAVFHWAAYGGGLDAMVVAGVFGAIFYGIMKTTNIWMAAGVHAGLNLAILHIFQVLVW